MFGFSVFMNEDLTAAELEQMTAMASGFKGIFTSMHIPEDDRSTYRQRLTDLGGFAKDHQLSLMVDISGNALAEAGFSIDNLAELRESVSLVYEWTMPSTINKSQLFQRK